MILQNSKKDTSVIGIEGKSIGIDASKSDKILYLLSEGIYKDPLSSIVRELCSNIVDSYVKAGLNILDNPGKVILTKDSLSFVDYGAGMSSETVDTIYNNLLASDKEDSNDFIGSFGAGSKSPWSYTNQFFVTTVHNKSKRIYLISKEDAKCYNISEETVDEPNGTIVSFTIGYSDINKWHNSIVETIPYFRGIIYENTCDPYRSKNFMENPLIEGKTFFYHSYAYTGLHVSLDQVIYPIDKSFLTLPQEFQKFIFGIKLSIKDGITPTLSRENLILNEYAKSLIIDKLKECLIELNSFIKNTEESLEQYYSNDYVIFCFGDENIKIKKEDYAIYCKHFDIKSNIRLKRSIFEEVPIEKLKSLFYSTLVITREINTIKMPLLYAPKTYLYHNHYKFIRTDEEMTPKFKAFLYDFYYNYRIVEIKKLSIWHVVIPIFRNIGIPKEKWIPLIRALKEEVLEVYNTISEVDLEAYKEWLLKRHSQKNKTRSKPIRVSNDEIKIGLFAEKKITRIPLRIKKIEDLKRERYLHVYTTNEGCNKHVPERYDHVKVFIPEKFIDSVKDLTNFISIDDYYNSKAYSRYCTKCYITENLFKYRYSTPEIDILIHKSKMYKEYFRQSVVYTRREYDIQKVNPSVIKEWDSINKKVEDLHTVLTKKSKTYYILVKTLERYKNLYEQLKNQK